MLGLALLGSCVWWSWHVVGVRVLQQCWFVHLRMCNCFGVRRLNEQFLLQFCAVKQYARMHSITGRFAPFLWTVQRLRQCVGAVVSLSLVTDRSNTFFDVLCLSAIKWEFCLLFGICYAPKWELSFLHWFSFLTGELRIHVGHTDSRPPDPVQCCWHRNFPCYHCWPPCRVWWGQRMWMVPQSDMCQHQVVELWCSCHSTR